MLMAELLSYDDYLTDELHPQVVALVGCKF